MTGADAAVAADATSAVIAVVLFVAGLRLFVAPRSLPNLAFALALLFVVASLIATTGGTQ